jgi:hypothetical protein
MQGLLTERGQVETMAAINARGDVDFGHPSALPTAEAGSMPKQTVSAQPRKRNQMAAPRPSFPAWEECSIFAGLPPVPITTNKYYRHREEKSLRKISGTGDHAGLGAGAPNHWRPQLVAPGLAEHFTAT